MLFFSSRSRLQHGLSFHNYFGDIFEYLLVFFNIRIRDDDEELKICEGTEFACDATTVAAGSCQCVKHQY